MIKTLKTIAALSALLSVGCVVFAVSFALRTDADADSFLKEPGEVDKFAASAKISKKDEASQDSPLVSQAEKFALRINPPPPPPPKIPDIPTMPDVSQTARKSPPPSAKFTVAGTVVSSADPNRSMALLNTVAKGLKWYRQSEKIGHLTIIEIREGVIVIDDGSTTYEMQMPIKQKVSLLKGDPANPYGKEGRQKVTAPLNTSKRATRRGVLPPGRTPAPVVSPTPTADQIKENIKFLQEIANDPAAMGIGTEEAKTLADMTEFVDALEKELVEAQRREAKEKSEAAKRKPRARSSRTRSK